MFRLDREMDDWMNVWILNGGEMIGWWRDGWIFWRWDWRMGV